MHCTGRCLVPAALKVRGVAVGRQTGKISPTWGHVSPCLEVAMAPTTLRTGPTRPCRALPPPAPLAPQRAFCPFIPPTQHLPASGPLHCLCPPSLCCPSTPTLRSHLSHSPAPGSLPGLAPTKVRLPVTGTGHRGPFENPFHRRPLTSLQVVCPLPWETRLLVALPRPSRSAEPGTWRGSGNPVQPNGLRGPLFRDIPFKPLTGRF